jgi:hypothetical protein
MAGTMKTLRARARGSALATVVLVILVLTIVGIGIAYFTQIEDRLAGNSRMQKAGFYAADSGLRKGEAVLGAAVNSSVALSSILNYTGSTPTLPIPGGGYQAVILNATDPEDATLKEFLNIPLPAASAVVDKVQYSLYVRNNAEDFAGSALTDTDNIINLVSVGMVRLPGTAGTTMTTILEEQLVVATSGAESGSMKGGNPGGTGTGSKKG